MNKLLQTKETKNKIDDVIIININKQTCLAIAQALSDWLRIS
jgi:hypothetical protein